MPIQVTATRRINTCADCEHCKYYTNNLSSSARIDYVACNNGKRLVNPTDEACEYFKCKCCGMSSKERNK